MGDYCISRCYFCCSCLRTICERDRGNWTDEPSSYVFLVPVFGVIGGWALLGENIGASMIVGFILIVVGVREVQKQSERVLNG